MINCHMTEMTWILVIIFCKFAEFSFLGSLGIQLNQTKIVQISNYERHIWLTGKFLSFLTISCYQQNLKLSMINYVLIFLHRESAAVWRAKASDVFWRHSTWWRLDRARRSGPDTIPAEESFKKGSYFFRWARKKITFSCKF